MSKLPKATHTGTIKIGDVSIPCAVLSDGKRVLSDSGISNALIGGRSGASKKLAKMSRETGRAPLPVFLAPSQLKPFIDKHLGVGPLQPVFYLVNGNKTAGFDATILPTACEIWLEAREVGALQPQQLPKAKKAEILMRGLARVGIAGLVDEATGFQKDRAKNALAEILEKFVAKELQPWVKTFPSDYYEQLFRLYGIKFPPDARPQWKPAFFGHITNNVIYSRLAPDLVRQLKDSADASERNSKLHQWLTKDVGHPKLREHLSSIVTLMKLSKSPVEFYQLVEKIHPRLTDEYDLLSEEAAA